MSNPDLLQFSQTGDELIGILTPGDQYQHQRIALSNGDKYEVYSGHTEIIDDMVRVLAQNEQGEYLREIFLRKESIISVEKVRKEV